jgi:A/G-specific adenine glycosylase
LPHIGHTRIVDFRKALLAWYDANRRDLPWRGSRDPWAILVSEIMLQQTRVETVIPYYQRFLERYPAAAVFAAASEAQMLTAWAGLGYYSRARNLQRAAQSIAAAGFPRDYSGLRALAGVGDYTAAAVGSIAFGLPHAALDGNVARVIARLMNDCANVKAPKTRTRFQAIADDLLDRRRPGDFNQAMMELGAVICTPRNPKCERCPVAHHCMARTAGRERELPVRGEPAQSMKIESTLLAIERRGRILLWQRAGFWELPESGALPGAAAVAPLGRFRHSIMNRHYTFTVMSARIRGTPEGYSWFVLDKLHEIPLSTTANKGRSVFIKSRSKPVE